MSRGPVVEQVASGRRRARGSALHPMRIAARRTGLKPDLIRAWERRYGVVEPARTASNRRRYSEADIERLRLLKRAVDTGWPIGELAGLDDEQIRELLDETTRPAGTTTSPAPRQDPSATAALRSSCLDAVGALDGDRLLQLLDEAALRLSRIHLFDQLLKPLMDDIGERYRQGALRSIHEHLASETLRSFLGGLRPAYPPHSDAPHLVVATPENQHHGIGALLVAATANSEGWGVTYLGTNLPAPEIAAAARAKRARAVALSITLPGGGGTLAAELTRLRRLLERGTDLLVGGQAAAGHGELLRRLAAHRLSKLSELRRALERMRLQSRSERKEAAG